MIPRNPELRGLILTFCAIFLLTGTGSHAQTTPVDTGGGPQWALPPTNPIPPPPQVIPGSVPQNQAISAVFGQTVHASAKATITFPRNSLSLGDQWSTRVSLTNPQVEATALLDKWRVSVAWSPRWSIDDSFVPASDFAVGGQTFRVSDAARATSVKMSWQFQDEARVRVESATGQLRPTMQVAKFGAVLNATGRVDDKDVTVSKDYKAVLWSAGATYVGVYPGMEIKACVLAGVKTNTAELSAVFRVADHVNGYGGFRWGEVKVDDLVVRSAAPWVGVEFTR